MTSVPLLRCATAVQERGDSPAVTATPVTRWLLAEQPGAWGRDAARQSGLDRDLAEALLARVTGQGVRLLLIRRYGRAVPGRRRWAYVDSQPGSEATYWGSVSADHELLDLPLDGSAGTATTAPIFLVCTHGRHDACCAIRGRPVAAALHAIRPAETWECSHVGGDRFAANLVVLPHGLVYGHVTAATAVDVVAAHEGGLVVPGLLRGRSCFPGPVQAAQHFARLQLREYGISALAPQAVTTLSDSTWQVRLARTAGDLEVTVAAEQTAPARLTCAATRNVVATTYRLVSALPAPPPSARRCTEVTNPS